MTNLYNMVFKRKSIRKFDKSLSISDEELTILQTKINELKPLKNDIKVRFVIMLAFGKCRSEDFRKDISEFKRKPINFIWHGNYFLEIAKVVRIAPSGCNLQPWRIFCNSHEIKVCKDSNTKSFPEKKLAFYNETDFSLIDMGICLCYFEISLQYYGYCYEKKLSSDNDSTEELFEIARYYIN